MNGSMHLARTGLKWHRRCLGMTGPALQRLINCIDELVELKHFTGGMVKFSITINLIDLP